jgi:hypothetical protein
MNTNSTRWGAELAARTGFKMTGAQSDVMIGA